MRKRCLPPSKPQMADASACVQATLVPRALFSDPPDVVARKLLGKLLVRAGEPIVGRIVEVEAYFGERDPAAHSFAGKTARNAVLFGPPGHAYVYFIYGMHFCLNVSCEPAGQAGGVLFRALEPISGVKEMAQARGVEMQDPRHPTNKALINLTSGPGRLCEAFSITRTRDNAGDLTNPASSLWIGSDGTRPRGIRTSPRIGITKAVD